MWLLSGLLAFVRLQGFALEDAVLFNTLVTSLSKSLTHQASVSASHTAFIGLKRREFYLSNLPAYFSDVNKRVGGCLAAHWEIWESWGADPWVVQVLRFGYWVPFRSRPPLSRVPLPLPSYTPTSIRGVGSCCCGGRPAGEGSHRSGSLFPRLLQPSVCDTQGHWRVASGDRPLTPQLLGGCLSFSHGDCPVGSPVSPSGGLDGILGPPGCLPSGSGSSIFSLVPEVLRGRVGFSVPRPLFRPFDAFAGVHIHQGPSLLDHASVRVQDPPLPGRLARPGILLSGDCAGEGLSAVVVSGAGYSGQPSEELPDSHTVYTLSRDEDSDFSFEGFPDSQTGSEAVFCCQ